MKVPLALALALYQGGKLSPCPDDGANKGFESPKLILSALHCNGINMPSTVTLPRKLQRQWPVIRLLNKDFTRFTQKTGALEAKVLLNSNSPQIPGYRNPAMK